jgi:hypothetical protein
MSRKRLGKREREARKRHRRGSIWFVPKGTSEYVQLKLGRKKFGRLNTSGKKANAPS